jgi:L-iditol 2-dehydrogenase
MKKPSSVEKYRRLAEFPSKIPKEMLALVLSGKGFSNLDLRRLPVPEPGPDQFLARVDACFACASDGKIIENGPDHPLLGGWDTSCWPIVIGHEGCITAVKVGKNLRKRISIGDTFAVQPAVNISPMNHRERYRNASLIDKVAIGYSLGGFFAEYILVLEEVITTDSLIPYDASKISYFAAAFAEPLSCVYSSQNQVPHISKKGPLSPRVAHLGLKTGGVVLILGGGPMGILHAEMAMTCLPRAIILSEPLPERRQNAEAILRAKSARKKVKLIITAPDALSAVIERLTDGRGVDDCIAALGIAGVQEESLRYLARYGVASFFGGTKPGESLITVDTRRIHYDSIILVGSSGGEPSDFQAIMGLLAAGEISPQSYIRRVGGLDSALELVKSVKSQEFFGKGLIYPHVRHPLLPVDSWSGEKEDAFLEANLPRKA